jgi:hypothetical protein
MQLQPATLIFYCLFFLLLREEVASSLDYLLHSVRTLVLTYLVYCFLQSAWYTVLYILTIIAEKLSRLS